MYHDMENKKLEPSSLFTNPHFSILPLKVDQLRVYLFSLFFSSFVSLYFDFFFLFLAYMDDLISGCPLRRRRE